LIRNLEGFIDDARIWAADNTQVVMTGIGGSVVLLFVSLWFCLKSPAKPARPPVKTD